MLRRNLIGALTLASLIIVSLASSAAAQPGGGSPAAGAGTSLKPVLIIHTSPRLQELPYPGQPVTLVGQLTNTRDTNYTVRIALVSDGKYTEVSTKDGYLDKNDLPTYEASVPAPVAEMAYQFLVYNTKGEVISSPRFSVRRACIPQVQIAKGEVDAGSQGTERVAALNEQVKALENELAGYQRVVKLLQDIQTLVKD